MTNTTGICHIFQPLPHFVLVNVLRRLPKRVPGLKHVRQTKFENKDYLHNRFLYYVHFLTRSLDNNIPNESNYYIFARRQIFSGIRCTEMQLIFI